MARSQGLQIDVARLLRKCALNLQYQSTIIKCFVYKSCSESWRLRQIYWYDSMEIKWHLWYCKRLCYKGMTPLSWWLGIKIACSINTKQSSNFIVFQVKQSTKVKKMNWREPTLDKSFQSLLGELTKKSINV
jgi:hypothetical protein